VLRGEEAESLQKKVELVTEGPRGGVDDSYVRGKRGARKT